MLDTLERPDLETIPYEDTTSSDETRTHIINPPNNLHIWKPGMEIQDLVNIARSMEIPITALCGYVFIPKRNPDKYPACDECIKLAGELMRGAGE